VVYGEDRVASVASPFVVPAPRAYPVKAGARADIVLELGSAMGGGHMGHGGGTTMMRWTINGRSHPDTSALDVKVGKLVIMRVYDRDMMAMMMDHQMQHSVHLHGTTFQVLSINGVRPSGELWKDTVPVPSRGYNQTARVSEHYYWSIFCRSGTLSSAMAATSSIDRPREISFNAKRLVDETFSFSIPFSIPSSIPSSKTLSRHILKFSASIASSSPVRNSVYSTPSSSCVICLKYGL